MITTADKIKHTSSEAASLVQEWKDLGYDVVFTNGCFDLLHRGHVEYLEKSAALGDKLVVGLNSDVSIRKIKGEERPIIDEISRATIIAAMTYVDMVVIFEDETPIELIESLSPDILTKGGDYALSDVVGYGHVKDFGGRVEIIPFSPGYSTSSIIKKIKNNAHNC